MKHVLLAGATGHLGRYVLAALKQKGHTVTALVRTPKKAATLSPGPDHTFFADATDPESLKGCCKEVDVVISTMGKSISFSDKGSASFQEIDYMANYNLLQEAKAAGIQQFVYVSAFTAGQHPTLAYFKAHADFSDALRRSGISYTILEPTALFSAFDEMAAMAKAGKLSVIGSGEQKTNPIFEGNPANVMVESIGKPSAVIPIGGKRIYSRLEIAKLVSQAVSYRGRIWHAPKGIVQFMLPLLKLFNLNLYHKATFLVEVTTRDCVAPQVGRHTLEAYFGLEQEPAAANASG